MSDIGYHVKHMSPQLMQLVDVLNTMNPGDTIVFKTPVDMGLYNEARRICRPQVGTNLQPKWTERPMAVESVILYSW